MSDGEDSDAMMDVGRGYDRLRSTRRVAGTCLSVAWHGVAWRGADAVARYVRTSWSTALVVVTVVVTGLLDLPAPDTLYLSF